MRLTSTCSLVPIYKDITGNLRPIAIGCVWRLQPTQFGVGTPDGASAMAKSLQHTASTHEGIAMVKIDLANAFSQVSRSYALGCLSAIDPLLAQSQCNWLATHTHAVMLAADGSATDLTTTRGIPQGDAMSVATFSLVLRQVMSTVCSALPDQLREAFGYHAYVDDCVFWGPKAHINDLLDAIIDGLSRADLSVNHDKSTIWCPDADPSGLSPHARNRFLAQPRCDGLFVCGQPLWMLPMMLMARCQ